MKVADHITKEEYKISDGMYSSKTLPVGSFVKPIHEYYLPRHIKDSNEFKYWNRETHVFAYCHYGIVLIERRIIREIA